MSSIIVAPPEEGLEQAIRDIHARMSSELLLLARLVRAHPGPVVLVGLFDPGGRIVAVSRGWEAVLGWTQDEIEARTWQDFVAGDDLVEFVDRAVVERKLAGLRTCWYVKPESGDKPTHAVQLEWESTAMQPGGINLCTALVVDRFALKSRPPGGWGHMTRGYR